MTKLYAEPGTERWLKTGKHMLAALQERRAGLRLPVLYQHRVPEPGVRIDVKAAEHGAYVYITGGGGGFIFDPRITTPLSLTITADTSLLSPSQDRLVSWEPVTEAWVPTTDYTRHGGYITAGFKFKSPNVTRGVWERGQFRALPDQANVPSMAWVHKPADVSTPLFVSGRRIYRYDSPTPLVGELSSSDFFPPSGITANGDGARLTYVAQGLFWEAVLDPEPLLVVRSEIPAAVNPVTQVDTLVRTISSVTGPGNFASSDSTRAQVITKTSTPAPFAYAHIVDVIVSPTCAITGTETANLVSHGDQDVPGPFTYSSTATGNAVETVTITLPGGDSFDFNTRIMSLSRTGTQTGNNPGSGQVIGGQSGSYTSDDTVGTVRILFADAPSGFYIYEYETIRTQESGSTVNGSVLQSVFVDTVKTVTRTLELGTLQTAQGKTVVYFDSPAPAVTAGNVFAGGFQPQVNVTTVTTTYPAQPIARMANRLPTSGQALSAGAVSAVVRTPENYAGTLVVTAPFTPTTVFLGPNPDGARKATLKRLREELVRLLPDNPAVYQPVIDAIDTDQLAGYRIELDGGTQI